MRILTETVDQTGARSGTQCRLESVAEYRDRIVGDVVAFTIDVSRIDARCNLSQDKPNEVQQRVANALGQETRSQRTRSCPT